MFGAASEGEGAPPLLPAEEGYAAALRSPRRQLSFRLGRWAARRALSALGEPESVPLLPRPDGSVGWPPGVCGALSHSQGYAVAIAARTRDACGLGIDLELLSRVVQPEVARRICGPHELAWVHESPLEAGLRTLTVFSAKESVFKALGPLYGRRFGFLQARLHPVGSDRFEAEILFYLNERFRAGSRVPVIVTREEEFLLTYCVLPPST